MSVTRRVSRHAIARGFERAERPSRRQARFRLAHAGGHVLAGEQLEVQVELPLHVVFGAGALEHRAEPVDENPAPSHGGLLDTYRCAPCAVRRARSESCR